MIDACDILIAIYDGTPGGTRNAVQYAAKTNTLIHRIKPSTLINKKSKGKKLWIKTIFVSKCIINST